MLRCAEAIADLMNVEDYRMTCLSISTGPEAMGVLVVALGTEGGFVMPCWTRRK
jgi:hypothetical protein